MSLFKKRKTGAGVGAKSFRKKDDDEDNITEGGAAVQTDQTESDDLNSGDVCLTREDMLKAADDLKKRRSSSTGVLNTSSSRKNSAFIEVDGDTEKDRDALAILEKDVAARKGATAEDGAASKTYKGATAYRKFTGKDDKVTKDATKVPLRASANVKRTVVFDYQPNVCKDYKETGFCGFGDSCLYLHDRGDYASGWQQEKAWEEKQAKKRKKVEELGDFGAEDLSASDEDDDDKPSSLTLKQVGADAAEIDQVKARSSTDKRGIWEEEKKKKEGDELPFACHICRNGFKNPIVTVCGHYFCASCIMNKTKTNKKCPICCKPTEGVFNIAHKIAAKLKLETQRKATAEEK